MSIAAPSNITLTDPIRVLERMDGVRINDRSFPAYYRSVFLDVTIAWSDAVVSPHYTKVKVDLMRGATSNGTSSGFSWLTYSTAYLDTSVAGVNQFRGRIWGVTAAQLYGSAGSIFWNAGSGLFASQAPFGVRITLTNVSDSGALSTPTVAEYGIHPTRAATLNAGVMSVTNDQLNLIGYSGAPWQSSEAQQLVVNSTYVGNFVSPDWVSWQKITPQGNISVGNVSIPVNALTTSLPTEPAGTQLVANVNRRSMSSLTVHQEFVGPGQFGGLAQYFYRLEPNDDGFRGNISMLAPPPVAPWTTSVPSSANGKTGEEITVQLTSNYAANWTILNNPGWLRIQDDSPPPGAPGTPVQTIIRPFFGTAMVGTPPSSGTFSINLRAARDAVNFRDHTCVLTIITPVRTIISSNASISRDGTLGIVGETVNLALQATPSPATWTAVGLPPGLSISSEGLIAGTYRRPGSYLASITAISVPASNHLQSIPFTIKFIITGEAVEDNDDAILRAPWLLNQWEITDLQVQARSKVVQSTLFEDGALRMKIGDTVNLGIFFVDASDSIFELAPSQLRLSVRKADNLDDVLLEKTVAFGSASFQEQTPYYLMEVVTGAAEREVVLEWAEENAKNEPLLCAADVEWTKDNKVYSSRTFPVHLELDVSRP
jgi:hypothetical protein